MNTFVQCCHLDRIKIPTGYQSIHTFQSQIVSVFPSVVFVMYETSLHDESVPKYFVLFDAIVCNSNCFLISVSYVPLLTYINTIHFFYNNLDHESFFEVNYQCFSHRFRKMFPQDISLTRMHIVFPCQMPWLRQAAKYYSL